MKVKIDTRAVEHWMVDNDVRTQRELADRIGTPESHLSVVMRTGEAGELIVLRLEKLVGKDLRV